MIKAETLLKRDGEFVKLAEYTGPLLDQDYVEGAIALEIEGQKLLGIEHWDYVDQLWSYIADGIEEVEAGRAWDTYFPDQPLRLSIAPSRNPDRIDVAVEGKKVVRASTSRGELLRALKDAGTLFFQRMADLSPDRAASYRASLAKLSRASSNR